MKQIEDIIKIVISNPKRYTSTKGDESSYSYYAGFSPDFVKSVISSFKMSAGGLVMDPWNGSGTTTSIASRFGVPSLGFDLNPVMIIAARATLLNTSEIPSILPLMQDILKKANGARKGSLDTNDPLTTWFLPQSANHVRNIEKAIQKLLINSGRYSHLKDRSSFDTISCIAAFFYVALFRAVRKLLAKFYTSNPTWIKIPKKTTRLHPSASTISLEFCEQVNEMIANAKVLSINDSTSVNLTVASSSSLPLNSDFIDLIITSPPYCTRIDYAIATLPELTILGYSLDEDLKNLRRNLIGSSTVPKIQPEIQSDWGKICNDFLEQVKGHSSKASATYYYKNHVQYFESIYKSVKEIKRVLKPGGHCVLVVQDSFYKDIHNDLAGIFVEMFSNNNVSLIKREDFISERNMDRINPNNKKYRLSKKPIESVLVFKN